MRGTPSVVLCLALSACGRTGLLDLGGENGLTDGAAPFVIAAPDLAERHTDPMASSSVAPAATCPPETKLVYVMDVDSTLSRFDPASLSFTDIGRVHCPSIDKMAAPESMAIDRTAHAWVLYSDGELFIVDVRDASCVATEFVPNGPGQYGMGFSANSPGSVEESLFVGADNQSPSSLERLDTRALVLTRIASFAGSGTPELTGDGDGDLWGFFPDREFPRISQIDKTRAAETTVFPLPALVGVPHEWAFATWGGDFYIFLAKEFDDSSSVYRMTADGTLTTSIPDSGRNIVGAGVSTCAQLH